MASPNNLAHILAGGNHEGVPAGPKYLIYALVDPRDGAWRYVGKSSSGLKRPLHHGRPSVLAKDKTHKANWIRGLAQQGLRYCIEILEEFSDPGALNVAEIEWIAAARLVGVSLTNLTDGGDGATGWVMPIATRLRLSEIALSQRRRPSPKALLEAARFHVGGPSPMSGRRHTGLARQKMSEASKGRRPNRKGAVLSEATRTKLVEVNGGSPIVHVETGEVYVSQGEAARALGLSQAHVWKVLHGHRKHASGQHFEFKRAA